MQLYLRKLRSLYLWLLVALADIGVALPWILLLYWSTTATQWGKAIPGVWLGLGVYAAAAIYESGERGDSDTAPRRRVVALLIGLVAAYVIAYFLMPSSLRTGLLSGNPALAFVPAAGYLWYMGAQTITEGLEYHWLFSRYPIQCGIAAVGVAILTKVGGMQDPTVRALVYWGILLVLGGGLLSLIAARERLLKAGQASIGEKATGTGGLERILGFVVVGLILITVFGSYLVSEAELWVVLGAIGHGLGAALSFLAAMLWLILSKYALVLGRIVAALVAWLARMRAGRNGDAADQLNTDRAEDPDIAKDIQVIDWTPYLKVAIFIGLVVAAAVIVYRLARRRRPQRDDVDEEIIDLGFWPNLLADLKSLFSRHAPGAPAAAQLAALEALAPGDPRLLFRRLQTWGAALGRPRQSYETPAAYGGALSRSRPADAPAAAAVTDVYNEARYGAAAPAPERVAEATAAMSKLEDAERSGSA